MKLILNKTPIDVGMKFGVRGGAQMRTSGKVRVADAAGPGDGGEQLLPVLKEDEIVDDVERDEESVAS